MFRYNKIKIGNILKFITKAKLRFEYKDSNNIKWYSLKDDLILYIGDKDLSDVKSITVKKHEIITVPKDNFATDLASIPYLLQWIYKPNGKYTRSAIIHDYLYSLKHTKQTYCDNIFRKAMKLDGVKFHTRWIFYFAVSLMGWRYKQ